MSRILTPVLNVSILASIGLSFSACGFRSPAQQNAGNDVQAIQVDDPIAGPLFKKYGALPYKASGFYAYEWEEYGRCLPDEAKDIFIATAQSMGVDAYDIYTVAMGEGLGFYFDAVSSKHLLLNSPVDGYGYLGTDFFLSDLPKMISAGILPPTFREGEAFSTFMVTRNEPADEGVPITIKVPRFTNLEFAIQGMSAYYARRVRMAEGLARSLGLGSLDKDEETFWGYYFFQNPGIASDAMRSMGLGILSNKPDEDRPWDIRRKSLKRVVTSRYFEGNRILELGNQADCVGPRWVD